MKPSTRLVLLAALIGAGALVYFAGIRPRLENDAVLAATVRHSSHPTVSVVPARRAPAATELSLPASLEAVEDVPVYARTSGYLGKLLADLGDHVKAGQPLAVIDGPEVDQELNQAKAALAQAEANLELARISATRWESLGRRNAVARQDVDDKVAAYHAREADLQAAQANVARLTQLVGYQTIVAPFDGVISARNVDVGSLVTSGSSGRELFRVSNTGTLRVYVSIPQSYVRSVHTGLHADVLVNEFPGRRFPGTVVRVAGALDPTTRTLLAEIRIPNSKGELLAGMFGQVVLKLETAQPPLLAPSNAVIVRATGTFMAIVDASGIVHFRQVTLGRDFGSQIQVLGGLHAGDLVVASPSDVLVEGAHVSVELPAGAKR
ncbi:multidrug resistance protein MdtA precursor [mine drainage metagenome]|uniref:Multidrug resistance protein MdtA n=1 Tax=mine drainage metagenome TaxID=410659 RepID=A0A1J5U2P5_9ZZZZ